MTYELPLSESIQLGDTEKHSDKELWNTLDRFGAESIRRCLTVDLNRNLGRAVSDNKHGTVRRRESESDARESVPARKSETA